MRLAPIAKLSLTAVVGLGSLLAPATLAAAGGPGPVNGGVVKAGPAPTTTTTVKPMQGDQIGVEYCDVHLCIPGEEVDPDPGPTCNPQLCDGPAKDKVALPEDPQCNPILCDGPADDKVKDDQGCTFTHGCPDEGDGGTDGGQGSTGGDDGGTDGHGTDGGTDGGTDSQGTDGGTDGPTTDGGTQTDGGTTHDGGSTGGGRLPKTGGEIMTLVGLGLGLTGAGMGAKRLARRS